MQAFSELVAAREPALRGTFGFVDGVHFPICVPPDLEEQERYYNGWLSNHNVNNLLCFAPDGTIIFAVLNAPGARRSLSFCWGN